MGQSMTSVRKAMPVERRYVEAGGRGGVQRMPKRKWNYHINTILEAKESSAVDLSTLKDLTDVRSLSHCSWKWGKYGTAYFHQCSTGVPHST